MQLRVLTWNIHKGIGGIDRRYRLDRIVQVLKAAQPDVALLQEVADHWPGAGGDVQVERLAEEVPLPHFAFSPEHRFKVGGYGNAVLCRFPIVDTARLDLKIGWRKQRSALQACIKLPEQSAHQHLFATSLHLGLAEAERRKQIERLFEAEHHHSPSAPSLLGGDFNDVFGTLSKPYIEAKGYHRLTPRQRSFPAALPCFKLDAIFGFHVTPLSSAVATMEHAATASDHLPLIADCTIE